jgi:hypothetical protein
MAYIISAEFYFKGRLFNGKQIIHLSCRKGIIYHPLFLEAFANQATERKTPNYITFVR